jgi:hypothetical protein
MDCQHILTAHAISNSVGLRRVLRISNDLGNTIPVSQIEKDEAAMVAPSVYPTFECDPSPGVNKAQLTTRCI